MGDGDDAAGRTGGDAGTAAPATSRAGRNLPAAIASGVALGAVVLVSLFTVKWLFAVVAAAAIVIGIAELTGAFAGRGIRLARTPLYASAVIGSAAAYLWGVEAQLAVFGATVVAILIWRIRRGTQDYVRDASASVFVAAYLPFMVGFVMLMLAADNGPQRIVGFILLTICNDIGGYATGVLFGKHPIAPQVSPKKSWEGFAGSLVTQCIAGVLVFVYLFDAPWWQGVVTAVVMTVVATAGDFAESAIKRDLGVKDMGTFLPGHGGLMDRLDSLVPNAFAAWALFTLFLGPGTA
ncbi:MAG: phosphatidate cytidylyltransferase [Candidatus Nanopelagicales bacterium]